MSYFNDYGLLNLIRNEPTENGILFLAYYLKLKKLNHRLSANDQGLALRAINNTIYWQWERVEDFYQANPPDKGLHFSRDNMYGLYFLHTIAGWSTWDLPNLKWNDRYWYHPNGWAVFLGLKSIFFRVIFFPLVVIMISFSKASREYKWWKKKENHTSGALLWWLMYGDEKDDMLKDFTYYVTDKNTKDNLDNPMLMEARLLWENKTRK